MNTLPPAMLDNFRQFRGDTDAAYFGLGDALDAAVVELAGRVTAGRIYKAAAIETDYSISEIRVLHETARAVDAQMRAEFDPPLVHSHYRAVRYLDDRAKQHSYLTWAVASADAYGGRPAPAVILARKIRKDMGLEAPEPTWAELVARAVAALERARDGADDTRKHDRLNKIIAEVEGMQANG